MSSTNQWQALLMTVDRIMDMALYGPYQLCARLPSGRRRQIPRTFYSPVRPS